MIQVTFDELARLGGQPRVGTEFETAMLDLLPGRFRVVRLSAHRAELHLVAWRTPAALHPEDARRQRMVLPQPRPPLHAGAASIPASAVLAKPNPID